ncbi:MAG: SDR family oxidoreductase [Polyangiaceae bacterium]
MAKARYLVTGGAGFIGSNIVAALVAKGEHVRVLDNLATGFWENLDGIREQSQIERITGDIRDRAAIAKACEGVEVVFHEGALGSVPKSVENPIDSDSANVNGTVSVLYAAKEARVKRVLFAASSSAYGETEELPKRESMTPMPLSPYAVTKLTCEHYMKVFANIYGIETLSLRYFNVFGPGQTPDGAYAAAIPRFVDRAISGRPIEIYGDGEQTRDFCFVKNTVEANLQAAATPKKLAGEVVNIAGGRRIALNDLVKEIGRVLGRDVAVEHGAPRAGDIRHSLGDISRAGELFGYDPKVKWEDGIAPTIEYLKTLRAAASPSEGIKAGSSVMARLWSA